jgi:LPXTG-site transpeptidase (sortase) family protein
VLTGHVYMPNGRPGPFVGINTLAWGDQVILNMNGQQYVYEVREVVQVDPSNIKAALKHQDRPYLTLLTCRGYDQAGNAYRYRVLVRAVLISVK